MNTNEVPSNREIWKSVDGYRNYEVSWFGRVRNAKTDRILKPILGSHGYFVVNLYKQGKAKQHCIHVLVAHEWVVNPDSKRNVDHIDGCKTNNHFENLRWATHTENAQNMKIRANTSSVYKGVAFHKPNRKWRTQLTFDGKVRHIGYFETEREAAEAYNAAATEHYGVYAKLNEIED